MNFVPVGKLLRLDQWFTFEGGVPPTLEEVLQREAKRVRMREWRRENADRLNEKERQKRASQPEHAEKLRQRTKAWRQGHPDRAKEFFHSAKARAPERFLLNRAKARAKQKGISFDIGLEDIQIPTVCPVLGIPLKLGVRKGSPPEDWYAIPTLDRIDNDRGYVKGNVRVISWRANTLKRNATPEELRRLAGLP